MSHSSSTCWRSSLARVFVLACLAAGASAPAAEPAPPAEGALAAEGAVDYLRQARPLLRKHCVACHGAAKQEGGLRLDTAAAARRGGDSGPAILPGKSAESLLVKATRGADDVAKMPPDDRPPLSADEIALLARWIDQGAPAPTDEQPERLTTAHWAFQPPRPPPWPAPRGAAWARGAIDLFVLAELEARGLAPNPEAERATLARRLHLDLLGLPPAPEEVLAFEHDPREDAFERLVDRLLASPAYGERWGRHWLDQARYADSNGYTRDFARDIWPYRSWVIDAINADLPFDEFTARQLAGDLLADKLVDAGDEARLPLLVATGFHRNTLINEEGGTDQEQFRVEAIADRVNTTGAVWLGLTLGCARCHSHKYDPISQREYYQLFAYFNNCDEPTIEVPTPAQRLEGALGRRAALRERAAALEARVEAQRPRLEELQRAWEKTVTVEQRARLPGPVQVAYDMPFDQRDAANKRLMEDHFRQTEAARRGLPLLEEIYQLRAQEPKIPQTLILRERAQPRETRVHLRGDFLSPGPKVAPGVPAALPAAPPGDNDRLALAHWLTSPENPLTARVVANRHWQYFFGRGLVETEDDFGAQGRPPSHGALLDWLALELTRPGAARWSIKRLHRTIVTSATYRQASLHRAEAAARDPGNVWLWRQNRLRVEAEIVRDLALAASGLLEREIGGPSVMPPQPDGVYAFTQDPKPWVAETGANRHRRGMYTFYWRSLPYPMLTTFDAPSANVACTRRPRSNTPLQALTLANDTVFVEAAHALARRARQEGGDTTASRAAWAFRRCLARAPRPEELARLTRLVEEQRAAHLAEPTATTAEASPAKSGEGDSPREGDSPSERAERAAWFAAARVLLNLDEFITRE